MYLSDKNLTKILNKKIKIFSPTIVNVKYHQYKNGENILSMSVVLYYK